MRQLMGVVLGTVMVVCVVLGVSAPAQAQVPVTLQLQEGDVLPGAGGGAVTLVEAPFINGLGEVAVMARLDNGDHLIAVDGSVVWLGSSYAGVGTLDINGTDNRRSFGISNAGDFIYMPGFGLPDSFVRNGALLLVEGDPAPGFPGGIRTSMCGTRDVH